MEAKTILLINVVAIQLISIFSDYWILIKYRKASPPPNCQLHDYRQMSILQCHNSSYTLVQQHTNLFRQCNDMTDITALISALIGPFLAIFGYFHFKSLKNIIRALSLATVFSAYPIIITMHIIHSTNTREPKTDEQFLYFAESGWSLLCAISGCILMGLTLHLCMLQQRRQLERQRSQRRRRQLHNALMSSCRQDIAMAIRARMTVI